METFEFFKQNMDFASQLFHIEIIRVRQSSQFIYTILTFNYGSICEHLPVVQYKTVTKKVRGFDNIFFCVF